MTAMELDLSGGPSAEGDAHGDYAPFTFVIGHIQGAVPTRSSLIRRKQLLREDRDAANREAREHKQDTPERRRLFKVIQDAVYEEEATEQQLQDNFIPQHGSQQLISPRAFFVSPLFRVGAKTVERSAGVRMELTSERQGVVLRYSGPELRQSDGLVFMALLNLARDAQVGYSVHFGAEDLCRAVFRRYDGKARTMLKDHIRRLQHGVVEFGDVSVQLCQRFHFPSRGLWSVALDPDVVTLFKHSMHVWVDFERRRSLSEGLSSWLYCFVESQSKLIPMPIDKLRLLCGSEAEVTSFARMLRRSLRELAASHVIDEGWTLTRGQVRWRKHSK